MRIYLMGYMYAGKSTLGRGLAELLDIPFIDTDRVIEERYRVTIPLFFEHYGEEAFRIIEQQTLRTTGTYPSAVIALGGGTPCYKDNLQFIQKNGTSIYLKMTVEEIMVRLEHSKRKRPLLEHKSVAEQRSFIAQQLSTRETYYSEADLIVAAATATPEMIRELIENCITE